MKASTSEYSQLLGCQQGPLSIYKLRRMLMLFTRFHWAKPVNHGDLADELGCYLYNLEEPDKGNVTVDLAARFNPDEKRNEIYVGLAACATSRLTQGHLAEILPGGLGRRYVYKKEATLRLTHIFPDPDVGTLAAESTETFLASIMPTTIKRLQVNGALGWEMKGIDEPRQMRRNPKLLYGVDVRLQISFTWGVDVIPETHLLKEIIAEVTTHPTS